VKSFGNECPCALEIRLVTGALSVGVFGSFASQRDVRPLLLDDLLWCDVTAFSEVLSYFALTLVLFRVREASSRKRSRTGVPCEVCT